MCKAARSDFEEGGKMPEESKVTIEKRETTICKSFRVTPSEAKRIEELKPRCAKKGLDFADEEARYQAKLAAQKAKAEAKKKK